MSVALRWRVRTVGSVHPSDRPLIDALVAARAAGDHAALTRVAWDLVSHHERGIRLLARETAYRSWNVETREDHLQECMLAAHTAILRYDPKFGASVLTWLRRNLRASARRVAGKTSVVDVGNYVLRARNHVERARLAGEPLDVAGIAARSGASERLVMQVASGVLTPVSLHHSADDRSGSSDEIAGLPVSDDPADVVCAWETVAEAVAAQAVPVMSVAQAARLVGVSHQAVHGAIRSGRVRTHVAPGLSVSRVWVRADDVAAWQSWREPPLFEV